MGTDQSEKCLAVSIMPNIADDVLKEVERLYKDQGELSDENLLALHSVFGPTMERALELLDLNCVTILRIPGGKRSLVQVVGSSGLLYTLFPRINYCPCPAYRYHVISAGTQVTCKHILVARLAEIMEKSRDITVSPEELSKLLCSTAKIENL